MNAGSSSGQLSPTEAEKRLIEAARVGETCDLATLDPGERTVRADVVRSLCVGAREDWPCHARGVDLVGAILRGRLDLDSATLLVPLRLRGSVFEEAIELADARTRTIDLSESTVRGLDANGAAIEGDLILGSLTSTAEIRLRRARVSGHLICSGATLENEQGYPLTGDSIEVEGAAFFLGVRAKGEINLVGARIRQSLDFSGAHLENVEGRALNADSIEVGGAAFLRDRFSAQGEVNLVGAKVGQSLDLSGAQLENENGDALNADSIDVGGRAFLCDWRGPGGKKEPFRARGRVNLAGAKIGRSLDLSGARLENMRGYALTADSIDIAGAAFLRAGFSARGGVNLFGAKVGQSLDLAGAELETGSGDALTAETVDVKGAAYFRAWVDDNGEIPFRATGRVNLVGARIGQGLEFYRAALERQDGAQEPLIDLEGAQIGGALWLREFLEPLRGDINLIRARAALLSDDESGWPVDSHRLQLDGFVYEAFGEDAPSQVQKRLAWLRRQLPPTARKHWWWKRDSNVRVWTQPYEQLASVYDRIGDEKQARKVRVAKQRDLRRHGQLPRRERLWNSFLDWSMLFGYAAWRPLVLGILLIVVGWGIFNSADSSGVMRVATPREAPRFQSFVYSVDSFVPVIDFGQQAHWSPNSKATWKVGGAELSARWVQWYLWAHILFGWLVTTVVVTALTGLVRRT
jgi:hypothetical protein